MVAKKERYRISYLAGGMIACDSRPSRIPRLLYQSLAMFGELIYACCGQLEQQVVRTWSAVRRRVLRALAAGLMNSSWDDGVTSTALAGNGIRADVLMLTSPPT